MLKIMRRRYRTDLYQSRVELIKSLMPHACIGVDVITGHPGETPELFQETFNFISSLPVSYLHVFTYSERPNTFALELSPVVDKAERKARTHRLRRLSAKKRYEFDSNFVGSIRNVLFEEEEKDGYLFGWTDNYVRVTHPFVENLVNRIVPVKLEKLNQDKMDGIIAINDLVSA